jgi:hypothetical protein
VLTAVRRLGCRRLMAPGKLDATGPPRLDQPRVGPPGPLGGTPITGREHLQVGEAVLASLTTQPVEGVRDGLLRWSHSRIFANDWSARLHAIPS